MRLRAAGAPQISDYSSSGLGWQQTAAERIFQLCARQIALCALLCCLGPMRLEGNRSARCKSWSQDQVSGDPCLIGDTFTVISMCEMLKLSHGCPTPHFIHTRASRSSPTPSQRPRDSGNLWKWTVQEQQGPRCFGNNTR